jgi:hypothetical protein
MWFAQDTTLYTEFDPTVTTTTTTGLALFSGVWLLIWLVVLVALIVAMWKIFAKAGKPGWAAIVPIYNIWVLLQIIGRPGWWIILFFIPFVNFVISIVVALDLGKAFGKDPVFSIFLLWLFSIIGYLILGFGKDEYKGVPNKSS